MVKVVKFGGSSLASAEQFRKVGDIIRADAKRRYVVPSAPGKRHKNDTKVTDMLYSCYALAEAGDEENMKPALRKIRARYNEIMNGLKLKMTLDDEFKIIEENFRKKAGKDYAASRGEYLNGIILANYLGYGFIDAADIIFFDEEGNFDGEKTYAVLSERLAHVDKVVIPGFYRGQSSSCGPVRELDGRVRFPDRRSKRGGTPEGDRRDHLPGTSGTILYGRYRAA